MGNEFNNNILNSRNVRDFKNDLCLKQHIEFSNNENYVMEEIPSNIGFFHRKKWIPMKRRLSI